MEKALQHCESVFGVLTSTSLTGMTKTVGKNNIKNKTTCHNRVFFVNELTFLQTTHSVVAANDCFVPVDGSLLNLLF